jgi:hypothetical protein
MAKPMRRRPGGGMIEAVGSLNIDTMDRYGTPPVPLRSDP